MPTVYKVEITKVDGKLEISPIYQSEFTDDLYNKFKWDKVNISYFLDSNKATIMSDNRERLSILQIGAENILFIHHNWDKIFSEENKKKFKESVG